ncbi:YisL family protein [Salirhabdus salicampi]|uniref:YisL family protein n=1 Tax=Salirhabdus salicampi TaxID=476102 RepID=UPI0020C2B45A|nr:YisL family protein [Salirhabdus salicampi]MCP8615548.1 YisL family protein [Salirhabdus salicampi]
MTHLHITSWVLALILFAVIFSLTNKGKEKPAKILQMVLRLVYLLILFSGILLFTYYENISGELVIKMIAGFWVIFSMEMITVKRKRGLPAKAWWIQWGIVLFIALVLGFGRLPFGVKLF